MEGRVHFGLFGEGHAWSVLESSHWQRTSLECPIPCHYLEEKLLLPSFEVGPFSPGEEWCSPLQGDLVQLLTPAPNRCRAEKGFPRGKPQCLNITESFHQGAGVCLLFPCGAKSEQDELSAGE